MNNGYPTEKNPKHSSYIKSIKQSLDASGHDVEVCCLDSDFSNKYQHFWNYIRYYWRLFKKNFSPYDYVLMNHYGHFALPLLFSLKRMKQPVIHWHGEDLFPKSNVLNWFFKLTVRALPAHTKHITPSEYFKDLLVRTHGIPKELVYVSPSGGVDTDRFAPSVLTKDNVHTIKLGFASGLSKGKGADFLILLLENINFLERETGKKIELDYIYYGGEKKKYDAIFNEFDQIKKWAVMPSEKMASFYQAIDILLFPTARKQESLGLVALEAMSCNIPVVGPATYAVPEYVKKGISGETYSPGNFDDFKIQLVKIIKELSQYKPREIIIEKYAKSAVINFYRQFFS